MNHHRKPVPQGADVDACLDAYARGDTEGLARELARFDVLPPDDAPDTIRIDADDPVVIACANMHHRALNDWKKTDVDRTRLDGADKSASTRLADKLGVPVSEEEYEVLRRVCGGASPDQLAPDTARKFLADLRARRAPVTP